MPLHVTTMSLHLDGRVEGLANVLESGKAYTHRFNAHIDGPDFDRVRRQIPVATDFDAVGPDEVVVAAVIVAVSVLTH